MVRRGNRITAGVAATPPTQMKGTVDEDVLKKLHSRMMQARAALDGRGGKEALIGSIVDLGPGDAVSSTLENRVIRIALDVTPELYALPPHLGLAAGVALAFKHQGQANVVVALADRPSLDTGSAHEALTYAAAEKLPLIVILDCASARDTENIEAKAAAYGIPAIQVDAQDGVAVFRVSREAIHRARGHRGPTLVQCVAIEASADPIPRIEHYLEKHGWWSPETRRELLANAKAPSNLCPKP